MFGVLFPHRNYPYSVVCIKAKEHPINEWKHAPILLSGESVNSRTPRETKVSEIQTRRLR